MFDPSGFEPGWCSLHRASLVLKRRYTTLVAWCQELGINLRSVGERRRYMQASELTRLIRHAKLHPAVKPLPPPAEWDPLTTDTYLEARTERDKRLSRRIEAASRWKIDHHGAYIGKSEMLLIERGL